MALQIEDGHGSGKTLKIDSEGRATVLAVTQPEDLHINQENGKIWSIPFDGLNPAGAGDFVVYIKNTGNKTLKISDIRVTADTTATQLEVHHVSGTVAGGSAITPVTRNLGSANEPSGIIESGTDLTGLTSQGILFFIQCVTVGKEEHLHTTSNLLLTKGTAIALLVETATANLTGVISLIEAE